MPLKLKLLTPALSSFGEEREIIPGHRPFLRHVHNPTKLCHIENKLARGLLSAMLNLRLKFRTMNTLEPVNNARRLNAGGENSPPDRPARRVTHSTPHPGPRHINLFSSDDPHPACSQPNLGPAILPLPRAKDSGRGEEGNRIWERDRPGCHQPASRRMSVWSFLSARRRNGQAGRPRYLISTPHPDPLPERGGEGIGSQGRRFWLLVCLLLTGLGISTQAQNTINVTNYGAIGDAVQFFANTVSNSAVVTTTNPIPSSAIGEVIELFGCGPVTVAPNCQDMVATIVNVVDGTNIFVSQIPQATLTNTFATCGYNNQASFQAAIAAVGADTNDTIYIPAGTYLLIPTTHSGVYSQSGIAIQRGGINFVGAGTNATILLSRGAWTIINNAVIRGMLVEVASPCTNNYPLTFSHLTMDGGIQQGNTSIHGFGASPVNGDGWDFTHDAFLTWCVSSASLSHIYFTNVLVQHWRGEEFKSIDQPANSTIGIYDCTFADGNATALNVYESWDVRSNLFVNLFQVAEYYQAFYSYPSYFEYNTITNITGNGFAFNGGKGNNPPFYMESNVFYLTSSGNGIETTPGDNIYVIGNCFTNVGNYVINFDLSCPGAQGTYYNSNIVISANTIVNPYIFLELGGGSGPTDFNSVMNATINNNIFLTNGNNAGFNLCTSYGGWTTNISFNGNDCSQLNNEGLGVHFYTAAGGSGNPYAFVNTNNLYWTSILTDGEQGPIIPISYVTGSRYRLVYNYYGGVIIYLYDTDAISIPAGAQILFTNSTYNGMSMPIFPSANTNITPIIVSYGQSVVFYWRPATHSWSTSNKPLPPTNFGSGTLSSSGMPIGIKSLPPTNPASSF